MFLFLELLELIADAVNGYVLFIPEFGWTIQPEEDSWWFDCTIHGNMICGED